MRAEAGISKTKVNNPSRIKVWQMFDRIARRYDLLNRLLSFRQDIRWRRCMTAFLPKRDGLNVLDVATGTADQIIALHETAGSKISSSTGVDMADQMLNLGRKKVLKNFPNDKINLKSGNAIMLPFSDEQFDVVTMAFGIRNVTDVNRALQEMFRVLKPAGRLLVLEFSLPQNYVVKNLYLFYFRYILPLLGALISGDNYAYRYLNKTVESFPYGQEFVNMIQNAGFTHSQVFPLSFGIASIYCGEKN